MPKITHYPEHVWRTGTVHMTIVEAHPYHRPVSTVDHKGAGTYVVAFEPYCPLCREEQRIREDTTDARRHQALDAGVRRCDNRASGDAAKAADRRVERAGGDIETIGGRSRVRESGPGRGRRRAAHGEAEKQTDAESACIHNELHDATDSEIESHLNEPSLYPTN